MISTGAIKIDGYQQNLSEELLYEEELLIKLAGDLFIKPKSKIEAEARIRKRIEIIKKELEENLDDKSSVQSSKKSEIKNEAKSEAKSDTKSEQSYDSEEHYEHNYHNDSVADSIFISSNKNIPKVTFSNTNNGFKNSFSEETANKDVKDMSIGEIKFLNSEHIYKVTESLNEHIRAKEYFTIVLIYIITILIA